MSDLFTPPPAAPRHYHPGLRREHAKETRDEAYRRHLEKPGRARGLSANAVKLLALIALKAKRPVTDVECSRKLTRDLGTPYPPSSVSGRRNELLQHESGALVEKVGKRKDPITGGTGATWRATEAGRRLLASLGGQR